MRHSNSNRKLSRSPSHRRAMLRNLVTSLLEHEEVRTTTAKAKEVRKLAERMITLGKRGTLASRRRALETIRSKTVAKKLFDQLAPRYGARPGGYTRIFKLGTRHGDNAEMSLVQLVDMQKSAGSGADAGH